METTINHDKPINGYERKIIMKKTTYKIIAAALSSAMIFSLTACKQPVYRLDNQTSGSAATTGSQSSETPSSTEQKPAVPPEAKPEVYNALLVALESAEIAVTKVTWMNTGHDDSNWLFPKDNLTCALADVTGDGADELLVLAGDDQMTSKLLVFSYDTATKETLILLTVEGLNCQGSGARGVVIGITNEGKLLVIDCPRDNREYCSCIVYAYNGKELEVETSIVDIVSVVDTTTDMTHTHKINDNNVTEKEYDEALEKTVNSMDRLLQYAFVCGDMFKNKVGAMTSEAKNFDEMHDYLRSFIE